MGKLKKITGKVISFAGVLLAIPAAILVIPGAILIFLGESINEECGNSYVKKGIEKEHRKRYGY
jgi:hypothetical protein